MAYIVREISKTKKVRIVTIENSIGYVLDSTRRSQIIQKEVGRHTESYMTCLEEIGNQDIDVIVIDRISVGGT